MSTEAPLIHYLPEVSNDVFQAALDQHRTDPVGLRLTMREQVDRDIPTFIKFAAFAAVHCDIEEDDETLFIDHAYIMAGLLQRQGVLNVTLAEARRKLDTDEVNPMSFERRPSRLARLKGFLGGASVRGLPYMRYNTEAMDVYEDSRVLEAQGLIERRPNDAMGYFFNGDYFLERLYAEDRRFAGEAALRLYATMNELASW